MPREHTGVRGAPGHRRAVKPVFVVSPARCGSTLLRYLLDSHPEVTSPPELNLSALLQHLADVLRNAELALGAAEPGNDSAAGPLSPEIRRRARKPVDEIMVSAANAAGASVFCDKSLTTVDHLATIAQCYPKASLVFLYRYPLDMIASGLEAGRWGFAGYGFGPFVAANPGNFVAALANYWIDRVSKMLAFERECQLAHARIYYELMCDDPNSALDGLFEFLGLEADPTVVERAFSTDHGHGPGDYKIDYSGAIAVGSIGRGSALPDNLAETQINRIDELLAELDYPSLDAARRGKLAMLLGLGHGEAPPEPSAVAEATLRMLSRRLPAARADPRTGLLPLALVLRGVDGGDPTLRLDADGSVRLLEPAGASTDHPGHRIRCRGDVLLRVDAGEVPFARAVHDGAIKVELGSGDGAHADVRPKQLLALLAAVLRSEP